MIRFNWEVIKKYTNNDIDKILDYLKHVYVLKGEMLNYINSYKYAKLIALDNSEKNNYLINVDDLVLNTYDATKAEIFMYLELASLRDTFTYYNTRGKVIYLPMWKALELTNYTQENIEANRLLMIDSTYINFIYEGDEKWV